MFAEAVPTEITVPALTVISNFHNPELLLSVPRTADRLEVFVLIAVRFPFDKVIRLPLSAGFHVAYATDTPPTLTGKR